MFTDVHGEGTSSTAESVSLGSKLAAIALLAPQHIVMRIDVDRVESFVAQVALEANLVPFLATGEQLLGRVHGLLTSKTNVGHG